MMRPILFFLVGLGLTACPAATDPVQQRPADPDVDAPPPQVDGEDLGEVDPTPEAPEPSRARKRMTIDQVRDSMERISGGVVWESGRRGAPSSWDRYAGTLGVPDFQESTTEDLSPSVLLQKFLDDAAIATCDGWMARGEQDAEHRFFEDGLPADAASVRSQILHLRRRVHGVASSSNEADVQAYVQLHDLVVQRTGDPESAWRTVCVALFTHPDFYAY